MLQGLTISQTPVERVGFCFAGFIYIRRLNENRALVALHVAKYAAKVFKETVSNLPSSALRTLVILKQALGATFLS